MFDIKKLIGIVGNEVFEYRTLAKKMNVPYHQNKEFSKFLNESYLKNIVGITGDKRYFVPQSLSHETGIIRVNSRGFGFVDLEEMSIFVPSTKINNAFNGDEVEVGIFNDPIKTSEYQGFVKKIVKRNKTEFVGTIKKYNNQWGIQPLDKNISGIFRFKNNDGLKINQEVKVKIIEFSKPIIIKVIKKLGFSNEPFMDIKMAIEDANIPSDFDQKTKDEALSMPNVVSETDVKNRKDLRDELIVTIDGDDTKDFDDAITIKKLDNGNYKLSVHIADVTHYVSEGSPLDEESQKRGTSVYLPHLVIPMLPTELSNGICSLNPNVDRLTLSADMEIDKMGNTVNYDVYESIINSKYRLTYKQVNEYYRKNFSWKDNNLENMLDNALELSKIIRKFKLKEGYIDFEIEESKIIVDDKGKTTGIVARERLESEMMIEDFMVRANETVAHYVESKKLPFIYRVHDKPELERVQNLQGVIKTLGMNITIPHNLVPSEFSKTINQIKETRFDDFMKIMMLRTMSKAIYSPNNIGHFGLASKYYTHFTSPIRRYPDLMVHRMLREYFFKNNKGKAKHFEEILPTISESSSASEQKAMDLERKIADMKKAEFYEKFIGQSFDGTIVSVMKFGFFVEFENKVDGLVHISNLTDGRYELTENKYALTNGKKTFSIGDKVNATVIAVSKSEGKIDLAISNMINVNNI